MGYFIYPTGVVNHNAPMEARSTSYPAPPFLPTGLVIQWRVNGVVVKTGNTTNESDRRINTTTLGDYRFKPWHAGLLVDFVISGSSFSSANTLTNAMPTVSGGIEQDEFSVSPAAPSIFWTYDDADGDKQNLCRVMVGSTPGATDFYDSGYIYGNPGDANGDGVVDENDYNYVSQRVGATYGSSNYDYQADFNRDGIIDQADLNIVDLFMGSEYDLSSSSDSYTFRLPELPAGLPIFWSIQVGDGEKLDNNLPDWPEPGRKFAEVIGESTVNTPPIIDTVLVDGV